MQKATIKMRANEFLLEATQTPRGYEPEPFGFDATNDDGITRAHLQEIANVIRRDCAPFIQNNREALLSGIYLNRGISGADRLNDFFIKGQVRQQRPPRDTPVFWHKLIDSYFQKEFGFPYRSASMFACIDASAACDYGVPYAVFPIGEYDICFSPKIQDFTFDVATNSDSKAINSVIGNMSYDDVRNVGAKFGFDWSDHVEIKTAFVDFFTGARASTDPYFEAFISKYLFPRLGYTETYSIRDLEDSEAMIKCANYYGILKAPTYRTKDTAVVDTLIRMITA